MEKISDKYSRMNRVMLDEELKTYAQTTEQKIAYVRSSALSNNDIRTILRTILRKLETDG
jgi:hypothetical protein